MRNEYTFRTYAQPHLTQSPYVYAIEYKTLVDEASGFRKACKWNPPTLGYKLNTDGSYASNTKMEGIRGVFRDANGEWILGFTGNTLDSDFIKAELLVLIQDFSHIKKPKAPGNKC